MASKPPIRRLLFICMGNICRSPAAESIMRIYLEKEGLGKEVICDSAGTIDFHQGKRPDRRMRRAGRKRELEIAGTSRQVAVSDLKKADLILVMDGNNMEEIRKLDPKRKFQSKIVLFSVFCREHSVVEVPDPYHAKDSALFERCLDIIEDGCKGLLEEVRRRRAA